MNQTPTIRKLTTIGVYGFTADTFFSALQDNQVDTFVDVRLRRGVRGSEYAFANSQRLQARLAELGIRYHHARELAPTTAVRAVQYEADSAEKVAKRQRDHLSSGFVSAYESEVLEKFSVPDFLANLPVDAQVLALCCVEKDAAACHRSLAADLLQRRLNVPLINIMPPPG